MARALTSRCMVMNHETTDAQPKACASADRPTRATRANALTPLNEALLIPVSLEQVAQLLRQRLIRLRRSGAGSLHAAARELCRLSSGATSAAKQSVDLVLQRRDLVLDVLHVLLRSIECRLLRSTRAGAHLLTVIEGLLRLTHCLLRRAEGGLHLSKLLGQLLHLGVVAGARAATRRVANGCLRVIGNRLAGGVCARLAHVIGRAQVRIDHRQAAAIVQVRAQPVEGADVLVRLPDSLIDR